MGCKQADERRGAVRAYDWVSRTRVDPHACGRACWKVTGSTTDERRCAKTWTDDVVPPSQSACAQYLFFFGEAAPMTLAWIAVAAASSLLTPLTRRAALTATALGVLQPPLERALAADEATVTVANGLSGVLEATAALPPTAARVPLSLVLRPDYGIESYDVTYPSWALGKWTARSTLRSVLAPAGEELFTPGRNGTEALRRARLEIGEPLEYEVRWKRPSSGPVAEQVVVDREYNIASISRASMGSDAVQNVQTDGPDRLEMVLKPAGAPKTSLFQADLRVVSRRTDPFPLVPERPNLFACAETTRQTVTTVTGERSANTPQKPAGPLIKEIETICTYELDPKDPNIMRGAQRTATFLVPDAAYVGDPTLAELAAARLTRAPNGRLVALDVRIYDLVYTRVA